MTYSSGKSILKLIRKLLIGVLYIPVFIIDMFEMSKSPSP